MAMITNIQGYSIHDGPGIRTVVFLKGCPLRCIWCANPENLVAEFQNGFLSNLCNNCGRCAQACTHGAISSGVTRIDRDKCLSCGVCTGSCYYDALISYGKEQSPYEVFELVRKDKMFYDSSGGGVTVSGGEALLFPEFVFELFSLCKNDGIDTCAETCGFVPVSALARVLPVTDRFYFDLKIIDGTLHKKYTGQDNTLILENARYLADNGATILFRQPLIPEITDTDDNIRLTAEFISTLGAADSGIELMPYHRAGKTKYDALDMPYDAEYIEPVTSKHINAAAEKYRSYGINCTISK